MAPEIQLQDLHFASQQDLMRADIWSLALLMFVMINPNLPHPYFTEFEESGFPFSDKALSGFLKRQQLPCYDNKYQSIRITQWWQIDEAFKLCAKFVPSARPTAVEVLRLLEENEPEASLRLVNLAVNQTSSLTLESDGSNCCAFLALSICDRIANEVDLKVSY